MKQNTIPVCEIPEFNIVLTRAAYPKFVGSIVGHRVRRRAPENIAFPANVGIRFGTEVGGSNSHASTIHFTAAKD